MQRGHTFAIVDEVDSILVDEARTPLIISGEPETAAKTYYDFARVVHELDGRAAHPQGDEGRGRDRALGRGLPLRREVQDRLAGAVRARQGRARARDRQPLRPAQRAARQPPDAGAQGAVALQARRRLRRRRRARSRSSTSTPAGSWKGAAGAKGSTRRSRRRRASRSARRTSRSRRSRSRTTSASTRSSPG